jgi:hypothetical protein
MNETTESLARFRDYFQCATGVRPYPYQERLALAPAGEFPETLNASTGVGKTAAAELGWLFRRRFHPDKEIQQATPRRLVYCLPMRVLVEQTYGNTCGWLDKLGLLAANPDDNTPTDGWAAANGEDKTRIAVHLLMGGEDTTDWALWPERDAILLRELPGVPSEPAGDVNSANWSNVATQCQELSGVDAADEKLAALLRELTSHLACRKSPASSPKLPAGKTAPPQPVSVSAEFQSLTLAHLIPAISWSQHTVIMAACDRPDERYFYMAMSACSNGGDLWMRRMKTSPSIANRSTTRRAEARRERKRPAQLPTQHAENCQAAVPCPRTQPRGATTRYCRTSRHTYTRRSSWLSPPKPNVSPSFLHMAFPGMSDRRFGSRISSYARQEKALGGSHGALPHADGAASFRTRKQLTRSTGRIRKPTSMGRPALRDRFYQLWLPELLSGRFLTNKQLQPYNLNKRKGRNHLIRIRCPKGASASSCRSVPLKPRQPRRSYGRAFSTHCQLLHIGVGRKELRHGNP